MWVLYVALILAIIGFLAVAWYIKGLIKTGAADQTFTARHEEETRRIPIQEDPAEIYNNQEGNWKDEGAFPVAGDTDDARNLKFGAGALEETKKEEAKIEETKVVMKEETKEIKKTEEKKDIIRKDEVKDITKPEKIEIKKEEKKETKKEEKKEISKQETYETKKSMTQVTKKEGSQVISVSHTETKKETSQVIKIEDAKDMFSKLTKEEKKKP